MSYTQRENIKACHRNDKAYLYALIDLKDNSKWDEVDFSEDENYHLNNKISYIGETSNPYERFAQHRVKKSRKVGMVIFNQTKTDYPHAEIKSLESEAIFNYCVKKGSPKWQKGAKTFSGA